MDKVWFKLRQADYPPPNPEAMGTGTETGPLDLGHFIPDLRRLDFPINRGEIEPFPRSMPVFSTASISFRWEDTQASEYGGVLGGGAPVLAAAGVPVIAQADVSAVFRSSVLKHEAYERLDTYMVQVNRSYVADCLDEGKLAQYKKDHAVLGAWSMFIITGLKIARAGPRSSSSARGVEYGVGLEAELPAIASARVGPIFSREGETTMSTERQSDFVWAVRLAKVHKGLVMKDWSVNPYTKKATFNNADGKVDVEETLSAEGVKAFRVFEDDALGDAFVVFDSEEQ
ncbi:hypothetical protein LX32DRAFT_628892 [Colletotrichum zoysiae]|uniref:Uncharacterized protein n=1 Tax=Colletotrichum zoysiae TaxID=1216348 RepID=A0AAD9H7K9_9PEZI|nr:hypothetical protein LX32DRAFT_628892 [Colletotrichum zoysiae]